MSSIITRWPHKGSALVLGRLAAFNGSGEDTGEDGEGKWLQIADFDTIIRKIFDRDDDDTPDTPIATASLTPSDIILDIPINDSVWSVDDIGYNLKDLLPVNSFPEAERNYAVRYECVLSDGTEFYRTFEGESDLAEYEDEA